MSSLKMDFLPNENELLERVASGDERAFTLLFHHYRNKIYRVGLRLTASTFLAEELVQDIFLKVWLRRDTLKEINNFEDYVFIMARNHVFSALKKIAREQALADNWMQETPAFENNTVTNIINLEYQQIIQQAIDQLPVQQKKIYILSNEQELKREEIAKLLSISSETVKTHLSRAIRNIREYSQSKIGIRISAFVLFLLN